MRRRRATILLATAAAALSVGLGTSQALAATWTVKPGGSFSGTTRPWKVTDARSGTSVSCPSATYGGFFKRGSGLSGTGIGDFTSLSFQGPCTGPVSTTFTLSASGFPGHINAASYAGGTVHGTISGIHIMLSTSGCSAVVAGSSGYNYSDSTHKLSFTGTGGSLRFQNVVGCFGLLSTGDPATIYTVLTLSPAQTITSP
jgi:hypothetical protein